MKTGKCSICGKKCNLTFEHIPPRGANNDNKARIIVGDELIKTVTDESRRPWEYDSLKYINEQRGLGMYSLCSSCNNLTGTLYGNDYIKMSNTFINLLFDNKIMESNNNFVCVGLEDVYIARFIRQVLSMFCSTSVGLSNKYPSIRKLILDKNYKLKRLPKYRISMFLLKNYRMSWTGTNALLLNGSIQVVSEIDVFPFGFIFEYDRNNDTDNLDITKFLKYSYDDMVNIKMYIPVRERNIMFPLDYRSKDEFKKK